MTIQWCDWCSVMTCDLDIMIIVILEVFCWLLLLMMYCCWKFYTTPLPLHTHTFSCGRNTHMGMDKHRARAGALDAAPSTRPCRLRLRIRGYPHPYLPTTHRRYRRPRLLPRFLVVSTCALCYRRSHSHKHGVDCVELWHRPARRWRGVNGEHTRWTRRRIIATWSRLVCLRKIHAWLSLSSTHHVWTLRVAAHRGIPSGSIYRAASRLFGLRRAPGHVACPHLFICVRIGVGPRFITLLTTTSFPRIHHRAYTFTASASRWTFGFQPCPFYCIAPVARTLRIHARITLPRAALGSGNNLSPRSRPSAGSAPLWGYRSPYARGLRWRGRAGATTRTRAPRTLRFVSYMAWWRRGFWTFAVPIETTPIRLRRNPLPHRFAGTHLTCRRRAAAPYFQCNT